MNLGPLRLPILLVTLAPLVGCLGAVDSDVEQGSAGLSRDRDAVLDAREPEAERRVADDGDRFQRCKRDWDCRPGDFCLAPDGDDRGDRPDVHWCGREPEFACESDRECGRGAECVRGNCFRLHDGDDDLGVCEHYRLIARRIRAAVAAGQIRPAYARELWRRLANAVANSDCGGGDDEREVDVRR